MRLTPDERGDTIIEVLFAVAVFAMVAVGCLSIMNQGLATAQRSLEVTLVRQQIQAQAEALRYMNAAYISGYQQNGTPPAGPAAEWAKLRSEYSAPAASQFGQGVDTACPTGVPGDAPFIVNARKATIADTAALTMTPADDASLPPYAQVIYDKESSAVERAYGLWIEAVPDTGADIGYVDFHIRACWESVGVARPVTLGTIVRLYDPTI